ncbi:MAG: ATP-binding cassette domain-containing protein [Oscillospiraceae bacterium]|nr:ATP-binding cassette domain-containing protein [Oscillospiraceae bacterium]
MPHEAILAAEGIDKRFGSIAALRGVRLTVWRGKILGLIGKNGSGKSTMTSILAGMQKPSAGAMTFGRQPWSPASMIDALRDVSLTLHRGEILGIGGLSHAGMHELGKALYGALPR